MGQCKWARRLSQNSLKEECMNFGGITKELHFCSTSHHVQQCEVSLSVALLLTIIVLQFLLISHLSLPIGEELFIRWH